MTSHSKLLSRMKSLSTITLAFTSLLLLSCFAIATLAWLSLTQSRVHYRKLATTTAQNICTVLADNLVTSYEKIDLAVLEVRDEVERQIASGHLDARRLEARIAGLRARVPVLHALRVVDAEGVVRHGDLPPGPPISLADRAYFRQLKAEPEAGLVFSKPLMGRVTTIWTVMLARRVNRPDGSFGGIVYGSINLEKLGAHFASLSIGPEGIIELRDPDLALIVGHGGSRVTPGERVASPDGTERIDVFTRLVPYGQHLRVGLGTREVFEPWRRELRQTLGFVAVFLLLVGASAGMAFSAWLRHQRDAERIRSREALLAEANSRLLELNHQKDQFLRLVVHDLRNPLSGIIMAAEALEGERDIAQVGGVARSIYLEGMEMTSLIARFLDIAKIDSGDIKAKPESFDLAALAHRIADCHEARSRRKGITFNFQLPPGGVATYADPAYAREVLDNLVSNAIKFSPAGTTVTMRIEVGPEEVVLSVEDQGPGLTEEDRAKLFSRFVTLSAKPTGGEKSTGLGLNIVKHMVEAMAGRIWVDSMPAKGAAFRVALPKALD